MLRVSVLHPATVLGAAGLAASMILGSCGNEVPEPVPGDKAMQEPVPDLNAPGLHPVGPNKYELVIHAFEGGFRPSEIRIPAGAEVKFRVTSEDLPHGFTVEAAGVQLELYQSKFAEATHTFTDPGEYPFQCHLYCGGGHESMHGRIIVESP